MADISGNYNSSATGDFLSNQVNRTSYTTHPDAVVFWKTIPPILLCCGTIGNILTFIVLVRKSMRRWPMTSYLISLAVFDVVVLYTGLLRQWIIYCFGVDIRDTNVVMCKLHPVVIYFSLNMSAWILVFMTVERTMSVLKPHKVKVLFSSRKTYVILSTTGVVLFAINCHFLYGNDIIKTFKNNVEISKCTKQLKRQYYIFLKDVFPWVYLTTFCLLPLIVQVSGNILIITKLVNETRVINRFRTNFQIAKNRKRQFSSMTTMLLVLNFMFLVCTLPISVYLVFEGIWDTSDVDYRSRTTDLVYATTACLMYANNTFNFVFYCLCGNRFRTELKSLFARKVLPTRRLESVFHISRFDREDNNDNSSPASFTAYL